MRRFWVPLGFFLAATLAWACGDKLMLVMGARFSQIKPLHPAVILAFPGQSSSAPVIRSLASQPALRKAGHRFQLVEDSAGLDSALKTGKYDVVLADLSNAPQLTRDLASAASKPVLLPVAFHATRQEQSAAQKQYHCLMKAPGDSENYLAAIEQAMEFKIKEARR